MSRDYLAHLVVEEKDVEHFGVKGMKWGVRRSKEELKSTPTKTEAPANKGPETSSERYTRLLRESKEKGANSLSDEDLRFVGARSDAINKINRLNERKPGWLADAAKTVVRQAAKKQMQSLANKAGDKYISDALLRQRSSQQDGDE